MTQTTSTMTRRFLRLASLPPLDLEKNHKRGMRTANDLPVKQFVRVGELARLVSPVSDSRSLFVSFSVFPSVSLLLSSLPPRWSLRGPCSQGRLLESSSLASRLLSTFSSPPPTRPLPPPLSRRLLRSFHLTSILSSLFRLLSCCVCFSLFYSSVSSLGFCERT